MPATSTLDVVRAFRCGSKRKAKRPSTGPHRLVRFAVLFETEGRGCFPHSAHGRCQRRSNCGDYNTTSTQKYNLSSPSVVLTVYR